MPKTLAQIRSQAQQIADMEDSDFVTDAEWLTVINQGYRQVYNLLVNSDEDYFTTTSTFTVTSGDNSATLPSDFYKLKGVDFQLSSGRYRRVQRFNFNDRNLRSLPSAGDATLRYYRLVAGNIQLQPREGAEGTYQLWYIPKVTNLVNDGDTTVDLLGFDDYIAYWAARHALKKEESSTAQVDQMLSLLERDIAQNAVNRDSAMAETISDADNAYVEGYYWS